jgi:hypothetical protein
LFECPGRTVVELLPHISKIYGSKPDNVNKREHILTRKFQNCINTDDLPINLTNVCGKYPPRVERIKLSGVDLITYFCKLERLYI